MSDGIIGIIIFALIAVPVWFWHDHRSLINQLQEANAKISKLQDNINSLQETASEKTAQAAKLQDCLDNADTQMQSDLVYNCKLEIGSDCDNTPAVYVSMLKTIQDNTDKRKDFCFRQFPQR